MDKILNLIENYPAACRLLKNCPLSICQKMAVCDYEAFAFKLQQGICYDVVYIILSGSARVFVMDEKGNQVTLDVYHQGNLIGEHEAIRHLPFSSSIESLTEIRLIKIAASDYLKWLKMDDEFSFSIIASLCDQLYELTNRTVKYALLDVRTQVLLTLYSEYMKRRSLKISKKYIMTSVSATARSIYRIINELQKEGVISLVGDSVCIEDLAYIKKHKGG